MLAPGMAAPELSTTVPLMLDVALPPCAKAGTLANTNMAARTPTDNSFRTILPPSRTRAGPVYAGPVVNRAPPGTDWPRWQREYKYFLPSLHDDLLNNR